MASIHVASSQISTLPNIPELYNPDFLNVLKSVVEKKQRSPPQRPTRFPKKAIKKKPGTAGGAGQAPKNMMVEALQSTTNQTRTTKNAPAYISTLSPTLDAFQRLTTAKSPEFKTYLEKAWAEDAKLTLRIIWCLRSIRDGMGKRMVFYKYATRHPFDCKLTWEDFRAFGWLYENHPHTAISNLWLLVEPVCTTRKKGNGVAHGYWKDLLNILALATVDQLSADSDPSKFLRSEKMKYTYPRQRAGEKVYDGTDAADHIEASLQRGAQDRMSARKKREVAGAQRYDNLVMKLKQPKYRGLYIAVARLFSERLVKDLRILDELDSLDPNASPQSLLFQLSLAGKWAPTPHGVHDRHTNIATAIIMLLRHSQTPSKYPSALNGPTTPAEEASILRSFYQRWVLTRLRSVTAIPEPLMTANRWTEIKYNRISSICMKTNMDHFYQRDSKRFEDYLKSVEMGRKTISGANLYPHELVVQALQIDNHSSKPKYKDFPFLNDIKHRVVEAQWQTLIAKLRESGSIDNSIAICDVSGSMGNIHSTHAVNKRMDEVKPILPAIALSLVVASLAKPPFSGGFITFSEKPSYVRLNLNTPLADVVTKMSRTDWGQNTDINAVFLNLLLPLARKHKVPPEDMIKRLFVFSDMQFYQCHHRAGATADDWATNYDEIEEAYKAAGYEMPQIVCWNLGRKDTFEVQADRKGVAMMNGFSPALLKVFMGENEEGDEWETNGKDGETETVSVEEEFNPVNVMKKAVMKKSFDGLVVVD